MPTESKLIDRTGRRTRRASSARVYANYVFDCGVSAGATAVGLHVTYVESSRSMAEDIGIALSWSEAMELGQKLISLAQDKSLG